MDRRWPQVLARMVEPLREEGVETEGRCWTEADDLADFDLVLPLTAWGYHRFAARWAEKVAEWERQGVRLRNPGSVLRWNSDKSYLEMLAERGAPVIPTITADRLEEQDLIAAAERFGVDRLVAKPTVSAGAFRTIRWSPGEPLEGGPEGATMIQPYLPDIEKSGEMSLIFFSGRFSHAIRKVPQPGDFRVQPEYQGIISAVVPEPDERDAAEAVLATVEEDLLYARVDLVRGPDRRPLLIELEAIEPDLYLGYDAEAGRRFAKAVRAECEVSPR